MKEVKWFMKRAQYLIIAGSIMLFCTAFLHASGYSGVANAIAATGAKPFLVSAVKGLWLMFSAHLIILSLVFVVASRNSGGKWTVLACTLMPVFDTLLLLRFVGVFPGSILLAIATVLFLIGGLLFPRSVNGT